VSRSARIGNYVSKYFSVKYIVFAPMSSTQLNSSEWKIISWDENSCATQFKS